MTAHRVQYRSSSDVADDAPTLIFDRGFHPSCRFHIAFELKHATANGR